MGFTKNISILVIVAYCLARPAFSQKPATVREYEKTFKTYRFYDPNPIPSFSQYYPYFRFDGFESEGKDKKWKIVELENDYIRLRITPEIGGKIWSAYDKVNGKDFIYENDVVKFRDIAMRGAWTSGGLEMNFGIIGHTPTVSTPVDYITLEQEDGSVSCVISSFDLISRTYWLVDIHLPKDKGLFTTKVYWNNPTQFEKPYYQWMNLAIKTQEDLTFRYPGHTYLGHLGEHADWPLEEGSARNLANYTENNFGDAKSYHVFGEHSNFFGVYYSEENYGMVHRADRDDKLGKKIFLWDQSRAGKIWEGLLTDGAGQYAEIQSGRLFNQNVFESSLSPFKQVSFLPYQTDQWTETWHPVTHLNGISYLDDRIAMHLNQQHDQVVLQLMSLQPLNDTIKIWGDEGALLFSSAASLSPLTAYSQPISVIPDKIRRITFAGSRYLHENPEEKRLSRPVEKPKNVSEAHSAFGNYLLGRDAARYGQYSDAELYLKKAFSFDSLFIPAKIESGKLELRNWNYEKAFDVFREVLSIDTYHPEANFYYGVAAHKLQKKYDALDGWEVAALSESFRPAAWFEVAKHYFREGQWEESEKYLSKSLLYGTQNVSLLQVKYLLNRLLKKDTKDVEKEILAKDPLNHFVRFETYLASGEKAGPGHFASYIRNEFPEQTYLELALWYYALNRSDEALRVLDLAPEYNLIAYWKAFLRRDTPRFKEELSKANAGTAGMVFPFRDEDVPMLEWIKARTDDWKPAYYLGILQASRRHMAATRELLLPLADTIPFAPLYVFRSDYQDSPLKAIEDLERALRLDPSGWRTVDKLAKRLREQKELARAQSVATRYLENYPDNYRIEMLLVELLLTSGDFNRANQILTKIRILPYEGGHEGRVLYRATKLLKAVHHLEKGQLKESVGMVREAREWPENLGVGKPYPELVKNDLEGAVMLLIDDSRNGLPPSPEELKAIREKIIHPVVK